MSSLTRSSIPGVLLLLSGLGWLTGEVKGTTTETVLICDVTATTARLNLNNSLVNETVESFTINVIATEIVGEPSVREGQAANTLASCLVGNVTNKTLTLPGTTTSAPLMDLTPFTNYEVHISGYDGENTVRTSNTTMFTTQESIPSQPRNLTVNSHMDNATILNVTWAAPLCDNGVRIQYSIEYFPTESDGMTGSPPSGINLSADATSLTLTGLTPNTAYNVTVRAWTANGPGDPNAVIGRTNEDVASSEMVLSITVDDVTATTAKIDWILISNIPPNRIVDSISIDLTPIEIVGEQSVREGQAENTLASCIVGNTRNKTLTVPGNATSVLLIDLTPFTRYGVQISGIDGMNIVSISNASNFTTGESIPSNPQNLMVTSNMDNATTLNVTWAAPLCDYGVRTQYSVDYFPIESDGVTGLPPSGTNLSADATSLTLTGLTPNTAYSVTIRAWTANGPGDPSTVIGRTNEDVPPAVSGLSFLSVTTSSSSSVRVIISWDQLSDRSGCFKYQLNYVGVQPGIYNNSNATVVERSVELTSVEDMYMFSGLPDAQYLVQISAISCNLQLSSPEATTNGTTVPLPPTTVRNVTAVAVTFESVRVSWDSPEFPNGRITAYIVSYKRTAQKDNLFSLLRLQDGHQEEEEVLVSNLKPFTNYTILVQAVGESGFIGPNAKVFQRTSTTVVTSFELSEVHVKSTPQTITLILPSLNFTTGPLRSYGVIVVLNPREDIDLINIGSYTRNSLQYITASWDNSSEIPSQFTVGDETVTVANGVGYYNAPLSSEREYGFLVKVQVASDSGEALVTYSNLITASTPASVRQSQEEVIVAVSIFIVVVVGTALTAVMLLTAFIIWKCKFQSQVKEESVPPSNTIAEPPVEIEIEIEVRKPGKSPEQPTDSLPLKQPAPGPKVPIHQVFPCVSHPSVESAGATSGHHQHQNAAGGFVLKTKIWANRQRLKVSFFNEDLVNDWRHGGEVMNIANIFSWAQVWNSKVYKKIPELVLEEINKHSADIRVELSNDGNNWSFVGMDAQRFSGNKPTMRLSLNGLPPHIQKSVVIHEFGHALGLEHEHQRSNFWEILEKHFDTDKIKQELGDYEFKNNWYRKTLEDTDNGAESDSQDYDPYSIMHYRFKLKWIKDESLRNVIGIRMASLNEKEKKYLKDLCIRCNADQYAKGPSVKDLRTLVKAYGGRFPRNM